MFSHKLVRSRLLVALALSWAGLFGVLATAPAANATLGSINNTINFQGRLLNAAGAVVADGNYNIEFKIYQDGPGNVAGDTGGTLDWTEAYLDSNSQGVVVKNGYFSVNLGSLCTLSGGSCQGATNTGVAFNDSVLWLSMNVAGSGNATASCATTQAGFASSCSPDGEMLPMKGLSSDVYAQVAAGLTSSGGVLTASSFIQNVAPNASQQTANFNILSGAATSVAAAEIQTVASATAPVLLLKGGGTPGAGADLLQLQSSGSGVLDRFDSGGDLYIANGEGIDTQSASGTLTIGGTSSTTNATTIDLGNTSTTAQTINIGQAAITSGTETIAIGTAAASGGTDAITIGNATNSTSTLTLKAGAISQSLTNTGDTIGTTSNSSTQFQVQNAASTNALGIDTTSYNTNLITNGGFESGTTGWAGFGPTPATIGSSVHAHEGSFGMLITTTTTGDGAKYSYQLAASTQYTFSVYAQTSAGTVSTIQLGYTNDGSTNTNCATGLTIGTGWSRISCTFTTAAVSGTRYIYIDQSDATGRTFYIDAAQLEAAASFSPFHSATNNNSKTTIGGQLVVGNTYASTSNAALQVNATNGGSGLLVTGSGDNNVLQTAFSVTTQSGSSLLAVDDAADETLISGGVNGLFPALGITPSANSVGVIINPASGQTAPLLQLGSGVNGPLAKFDANGQYFSYGTNNNLLNLSVPTGVSSSLQAGGSLTLSQAYYYVVTATNAQGETIASSSTTQTPVSSGTQSVKVSWSNTSGATGYKIYRNTSNTFTAGSLLLTTISLSQLNGTGNYGTTSSPSFIDTGSATAAGLPPTSTAGTGLTLQGWNAQTGTLLQNEDSTGVALSSFSAAGQLTLGRAAASGTQQNGTATFVDGGSGANNYSDTLEVQSGTLAANGTIYLPSLASTGGATGTLCVQGTTTGNCGGAGGYILNQNASQQTSANFWIQGTGRADTALQTPTLNFTATGTGAIGFSASAATANALTITGQTATAGNGGAVTVQAGTASGTNTGGLLTLQGGTAQSTGTDGGVTIDAGSGATSANGTISIGPSNASTITIGSTGATVSTINIGQTTATSGNEQISIGTAAGTGGKDTISIGSSTGASGTSLQGGAANIALQDSSGNVNIQASGGNTGIGTNSPSTTLQVANSGTNNTTAQLLVSNSGTTSGSDATIQLKNQSVSYYTGIDSDNSNKYVISSSTASDNAVKLGYSTVGALESPDNSQITCTKFTAASTGSINEIYGYFNATNTSPNNQWAAAVYSDNSGTPNVSLGSSANTPITPNSWNAVALSVSVTNGTVYWLCENSNGSTQDQLAYDTNGSANQTRWDTGPALGTWSAWSTTGSSNNQVSIYALVSPSGSYDTLGVPLVTVSDTGAATFSNFQNSTSAFQVQSASATPLLNADTTNLRVGVDVTYTLMLPPTSLTDPSQPAGTLTSGTTYDYVVTALDATGAQTAPSSTLAVTGHTGYKLTWTASTDASGYDVYRCSGASCSPEVYLATVLSPTYTDLGTTAGTGNPPATGGAYYASGNSTNSTLQLTVGGNGTPEGQVYVSGTVPASKLSSISATGADDVVIAGKYAYEVGNDLQIFDISNPADPVQMSSTAAGAADSIQVQGHYAYLQNNNQLLIYDVSNPSSPTLVGSTDYAGSAGNSNTAHSLYVSGRYAYIAMWSGNFQIIDVANPANPIPLGSSNTGITNADAVFVQGKYAYVVDGTNDNLLAFDISNPNAPTKVGNWGFGLGLSDVYVVGRYAYLQSGVSGGASTLYVVDISNPTTSCNYPASTCSVGTVTTGDQSNSIFVQGQYAYVANGTGSNTLGIYDIANPVAPYAVGTVSTGTGSNPDGLVVGGRYAYTANLGSNTMGIFDLGGTYTQQLQAGSAEVGSLQVDNNANVAGDQSIEGGLTVGSSAQINGNLGVGGQVELQGSANSTQALTVAGATDTNELNVDTTNNKISLLSLATPATVTMTASSGSLTAGNNYYVVVTAVDAAGNQSAPSAEATNTGSTGYSVSWTAVPGASSYRIYYSNNTPEAEASYFTSASSPFSFTTTTGGTAGTPPTTTASYAVSISQNSSIYRTLSNSTTAFVVQNASASPILGVDTTNGRVLVGSGAANVAGETLTVQGAQNNYAWIADDGNGESAGLYFNDNGSGVGAISLGTHSNNPLDFFTNGSTTAAEAISTTGTTTFQNTTNSTSAFQVQNAAGDDVFNVSTIADATNLISNASFENGTTGWSVNSVGTDTLSSVTYPTVSFYAAAGNNELDEHITAGAINAGAITNSFTSGSTLPTGYSYTLSFEARSGFGSNTSIAAGYNNSTGCTLNSSTLNQTSANPENNWVYYYCTFQPGSTINNIWIGTGASITGDLYIDAVELEQNPVPAFTTVTTGSTYYYELTAIGALGESLPSASLGMANDTSALAWTAVSGATGYKIYRNTSNSFTSAACPNGCLLTTLGVTTGYTDTGSLTSTGIPPTSVLPTPYEAGTASVQGSVVINGGQQQSEQRYPGSYSLGESAGNNFITSWALDVNELTDGSGVIIQGNQSDALFQNLFEVDAGNGTQLERISNQAAESVFVGGSAFYNSPAVDIASQTADAPALAVHGSADNNDDIFKITDVGLGVSNGNANNHANTLFSVNELTSNLIFQSNFDSTDQFAANFSSASGGTPWFYKNAPTTLKGDYSNPFETAASMDISTTASAATVGAQTTTFTTALIASTHYQLTFFAKCSQNGMSLTAGHTDNGSDAAITLNHTDCGTAWQQYAGNYATGATLSSPALFIEEIEPTGVSGASMWVDAISLYNVGVTSTNTPSTYNPGQVFQTGVEAAPAVYQNVSNSADAFSIQNTSGQAGSLLTADTANMRIGIANTYSVMSAPTLSFDSTSPASGGSLTVGDTYRYEVTAVDGAGGETAASNELTSAAIAGTNQTLVLDWTAVTGAVEYRVYRTAANGASGTETFLGAIQSNAITTSAFKDTGTQFCQGVYCYNYGNLGTATPPATSNAYSSLNVSNSELALSVGGNGTPTGQLYVSGTTPTAALASYDSTGGTASGASDVTVVNNLAFVTNYSASSMTIYDVSNPDDPILMSTYFCHTGTHPVNVRVQGNYAYITDQTSGFEIVNIKAASAPVNVSYTATGATTTNGLYVSGKYLYTTGTTPNDLYIYDITNPAAPALVSSTALTHSGGTDIYVSGTTAYVAESSGGGWDRVDVSNPSSPTNNGGSSSGGSAPSSVWVQGGYMYIVYDGSVNGMSINQVSNSTTAVSATAFASIGHTAPMAIRVQGRYAYFVDQGSNLLQIEDVSDPYNIKTVGTVATGASPTGLWISGRYAYVAEGGQSGTKQIIQVFDLGGGYIQQLEAGGVSAGTIQTTGNVTVGGDNLVQGSLTVGNSAEILGNIGIANNLGVDGQSVFENAANSTTALQVQTAGDTQSLVNVDTTNLGQVSINTVQPTITQVQEQDTHGTGASTTATLTFTSQHAGDQIMLVTAVGVAAPPVVASVSGGGTTVGWNTVPSVAKTSTTGNNVRVELWEGYVNTAGAGTITVTFASTISGDPYELTAEEFESSLGTGTNWNDVAPTTNDITPAQTSVQLPSLTASTTGGEAYFGYEFSQNAATTTGCIAAFTCHVTGDSKLTAYDTNLTSGTAYAPFGTQASGFLTGVGDIMQASEYQYPTTKPTLVVSGSEQISAGSIPLDLNVNNTTGEDALYFSTNNVVQSEVGQANYAGEGFQFSTAGDLMLKNNSGNIDLGTNTNDIAEQINPNGDAFFQTDTNTDQAFQVQNASGINLINVNSNNLNDVNNPDFIGGTTAGWTANGNASISTTSATSTVYEGNYALSIALGSTSPSGANITGLASVPGGVAYELSFYAESSAGAILANPVFNGGGTCTLNSTIVSGLGFNHYYCSDTTTSATTSISITSTTTSGNLYIDAVQVSGGAIASPATPVYNVGGVELDSIVSSPIIQQSGTNSVNALAVMSTAGVQFFDVDTVDERVYVGPTAGDTTGDILVLGKKTSNTDPTGVAGAIYFNAAGVGGEGGATGQGVFRCYTGSAWKNCMGMPDLSQRRWGFAAVAGNAATNLTVVGDLGTITETDTTAAADAAQTTNDFAKVTNTTTSGTVAGWATTASTETQWLPKLETRIRTGSAVTSQRDWAVLTNASVTGSDGGTTQLAGLRYSTNAGDADWMCASDNGTTLNTVSTGVAVAANTTYDMIVDLSTSGTLVCAVSTNGGPYTNVSTSTDLPAAATTLFPEIGTTTLTTTATSFEAEYLYLEQQ